MWVIRDRVGQDRRWYLSASLQKRPKYCSAKNERNYQKRSDHTRFGLHFMSWVPSVRFQPLVGGLSFLRFLACIANCRCSRNSTSRTTIFAACMKPSPAAMYPRGGGGLGPAPIPDRRSDRPHRAYLSGSARPTRGGGQPLHVDRSATASRIDVRFRGKTEMKGCAVWTELDAIDPFRKSGDGG